MKGFKDSTRTTSGFQHWNGGSIGSGTGGTINRLAQGGPVADVYPSNGDRIHGNSATQRANPPTEELKEHGGKTPLISKFKKGGSAAKHFHVHKHFHAKGGRTHSVSHSYSAAEKHAETYAGGGSVHDCTQLPVGGPDYAKGGHAKPVRKNAGGAMYAPGGAVAPPIMGGGAQATGALGQLAARPRGLPVRPALPMRRPMAMPGPRPVMRAAGGEVPMRKIAKQEVRKHVGYPTPKGHKGLGAALRGR